MSHFTVAVISEKNNYQELLAPFEEQLEVEFVDCTEEVMNTWENETMTGYIVNGELKYHRVTQKEKETCEEVQVSMKERYKTLEEYVERYYGYIKQGDKYGYMHNPKAKWDWYVVGGRWSDFLELKDGTKADIAKIKDVDFTPDQEAYNKALRFWELYVEKGEENLTQEEKEEIGHVWYKKEYYTDKYKDAEEYATCMSAFGTYAVITPDGEWHEKGSMGWWGISNEKPEEAMKWEKSFYDRFIKDENQEYYITIVDCHI